MKTVSIVIPTFKRPDFILQAVDSCAQQTVKTKIIVVDDNGIGTEDQLFNESLLHDYIESGIIEYVPHEINRNGSAARNTGIKHALTDYVAFLDDDDILEPNKIEEQLKLMEKEGTRACLCGFTRKFDNHYLLSIPKKQDVTIPYLLMNKVDTCAGSCLIVDVALVNEIGGFDESFERQQDLEFLIRILERADVSIVPLSLVNIRMHEQNLKPPNYKKTVKQRLHYLESFKIEIEQFEKKTRKKIYDSNYTEISKVALKNHCFGAALKWILKTSNPFLSFLNLLKGYYLFKKKHCAKGS